MPVKKKQGPVFIVRVHLPVYSSALRKLWLQATTLFTYLHITAEREPGNFVASQHLMLTLCSTYATQVTYGRELNKCIKIISLANTIYNYFQLVFCNHAKTGIYIAFFKATTLFSDGVTFYCIVHGAKSADGHLQNARVCCGQWRLGTTLEHSLNQRS